MSGTGTRPPNFVLFITDQHRADFLGCYGNTIVRTPQIDAIASRGTVFDRSYVASPFCMPNRASLMTGRMPSVHGVRSNGIPLSLASVTFADLLGAAGYDTALIGKSHLQNITGTPAFPPAAPHPPGLSAPPAGARLGTQATFLRRSHDRGLFPQEEMTTAMMRRPASRRRTMASPMSNSSTAMATISGATICAGPCRRNPSFAR